MRQMAKNKQNWFFHILTKREMRAGFFDLWNDARKCSFGTTTTQTRSRFLFHSFSFNKKYMIQFKCKKIKIGWSILGPKKGMRTFFFRFKNSHMNSHENMLLPKKVIHFDFFILYKKKSREHTGNFDYFLKQRRVFLLRGNMQKTQQWGSCIF